MPIGSLDNNTGCLVLAVLWMANKPEHRVPALPVLIHKVLRYSTSVQRYCTGVRSDLCVRRVLAMAKLSPPSEFKFE